jgi:hypothetical protein
MRERTPSSWTNRSEISNNPKPKVVEEEAEEELSA